MESYRIPYTHRVTYLYLLPYSVLPLADSAHQYSMLSVMIGAGACEISGAWSRTPRFGRGVRDLNRVRYDWCIRTVANYARHDFINKMVLQVKVFLLAGWVADCQGDLLRSRLARNLYD